MAEDAWNTRDPDVVVRVYTEDTAGATAPSSRWAASRCAASCSASGRASSTTGSSRSCGPATARAWRCASPTNGATIRAWFRTYGNENWEFNAQGLMTRRYASINDLPIAASERRYHWPLGRRPDDHPGLSELGL